jgi:hypothetical protein
MATETDTSARRDERADPGTPKQEALHKPPVLIFFLPLVLVILWAILTR